MPEQERPDGLTCRQWQIVRLAGAGLSDKAIGRELHITTRTVKNQIGRAYCVLGVESRVKLMLLAVYLGWVDLAAVGADLEREAQQRAAVNRELRRRRACTSEDGRDDSIEQTGEGNTYVE